MTVPDLRPPGGCPDRGPAERRGVAGAHPSASLRASTGADILAALEDCEDHGRMLDLVDASCLVRGRR